MTLAELVEARKDLLEQDGAVAFQKVAAIEVLKAVDDLPNGGFEGYASIFNVPDLMGDVILKGAFAGLLIEFKRDGFITLGHQISATVGVATIEEAFEDERGLYIRCHFHSDDEAQRLRQRVSERIERGATVSLSIHGLAEWEDVEFRDDGGMTIRRFSKLIETSLTLIPAQPLAMVTAAKDRAAGTTTEDQSDPDTLPETGQRFADESDAVLAAVGGFVGRATVLADLRARSNRYLSDANVERLEAHIAAYEDAADELRELIAQRSAQSASETPADDAPRATTDADRDRVLALQRAKARALVLEVAA